MKLLKIIEKEQKWASECVILDNDNVEHTLYVDDVINCWDEDEEIKGLSNEDIKKLINVLADTYETTKGFISMFKDVWMVEIEMLPKANGEEQKWKVGVDAECEDDYNYWNNEELKCWMYTFIENSAFQGIIATEMFYKALVDKYIVTK